MMNTMSMARCCPMGATAPISFKNSKSFTPGFAVPKKHFTRRVPHATMQVKAFKENSQLQDWRVKDMVEVCVSSFDFIILSMVLSLLSECL